MKTFYWYDYETFGLSPRIHRIAQFAGIRTDEDLNILDKHMFYCKPTNDSLPSPEACAVTGISHQLCEKKIGGNCGGESVDAFSAFMVSKVLKSLTDEQKSHLLSKPIREIIAISYKLAARTEF